MAKYPKGIESRSIILAEARKLLNEKGLNQTVDMLAKEMGLSRGKITNYFPTKESLLVNIMREYEYALGVLLRDNSEDEKPGFLEQYRILSKILDIQFEFRCAIAFLSVSGSFHPEIHQHVEASFLNRLEGIRMRLSAMVAMDLLVPAILKQPDLDIYCFQYTTLLTTWVVCQEMYYSRHGLEKMKPVYLLGVLNLYIPYLTEKGKQEFAKLEKK